MGCLFLRHKYFEKTILRYYTLGAPDISSVAKSFPSKSQSYVFWEEKLEVTVGTATLQGKENMVSLCFAGGV